MQIFSLRQVCVQRNIVSNHNRNIHKNSDDVKVYFKRLCAQLCTRVTKKNKLFIFILPLNLGMNFMMYAVQANGFLWKSPKCIDHNSMSLAFPPPPPHKHFIWMSWMAGHRAILNTRVAPPPPRAINIPCLARLFLGSLCRWHQCLFEPFFYFFPFISFKKEIHKCSWALVICQKLSCSLWRKRIPHML